MKRQLQLRLLLAGILFFLLFYVPPSAYPQAPVGTISGVVSDESSAVIPNANVIIRSKGTGFERQLVTDVEGAFAAPALPAGVYEVRVEMKGFRTLVREATVEVGLTTTADARLSVGQTTEVVNVEAATAQIEYERNAIDGVITRQKIQELPLNGRSYLNLAFLEPGVSVSPGTTSQYNALFSVSILGGATNKTSINVDGGNIRNAIEGGSQMNFSQEVVQEFQLSSVNFDLSTGITSVGSVNVVTRSGSNDFHGSGYYFFRDHNMAAYPALARNSFNSNPFFARRDPGFWVGGPIVKDKLFFFFNFEYLNQTQAFAVQPNVPSVAAFQGIYPSPYKGKNLSVKFDYRLSQKHTIFARYSHDGNSGFGPNGSTPQPASNWLQNTNWSDQSVLGVTSAFKPTLVNDFRFVYVYWQNRNLFPDNNDCSGCIGLNGPQITLAGSNLTIGNTSNATQGRDLRRFQFTDGVTWQRGTHRIRFGGEFDHEPGTGFWGFCAPFCGAVLTPEAVKAAGIPSALIPVLFPTMPSQIRTTQDVLNLPFYITTSTIAGVGDPSQPPPYNVSSAKTNNRTRFYAQDSWRISPKFTLNYGLAWEYESNLFNEDLSKPAFLAPVYGSNLSPTHANTGNWTPSLGFAWNPMKDNKTVIRGGFGIYYDTESLYRRLQERAFIGPVGNGRVQYPLTGFKNIFPGILDMSTGGTPVPVGSPLPLGLLTLTLGQFEQIYNQQIGAITASLTPTNLNDLSVRNIDISKAADQLYPRNYPVQQGLHFNLGVQHQLRHDMVVSVDFVRRVFNHVLIDSLDYNRFGRYINGVQTPVIPKCTSANSSTPGVECSNGGIGFWTPGARSVYNAMLVKVDKRFAHRYQFTVSYALQDQHGLNSVNGGYNLDNWNSQWGPQGGRNQLTVSAIVNLPWGFDVGLISTTSTVGPLMPYVANVDLTGSGLTSTPLPGLSFNCINRGCGTADLVAAVNNWNATYAGKKDARGTTIPALALPQNYSFGRTTNSQDLRLTKSFTYRERYKLSLFGEMFNVLNYANYSGFSYALDAASSGTFAFGQATQRQSQVFGSGGPRALQVGGRFTF